MAGTVLYVSHIDSGDIWLLRVDVGRGALEPLQVTQVGGKCGPLALGPDHRHLYAARRSAPFAAVAFAIDAGDDGRLTPLGETPLPDSMAYVSIDRSGRYLLSASYGGGLIACSPLDASGLAQPARQVLAIGPKAHCILAAPDNRHVLATSLGSDRLLPLRFDSSNGQLDLLESAAVKLPSGAGPRHFVFHPSGRFVYLVNELDASLAVFGFDAADGRLRERQSLDTLPPGFSGTPWAADLHLTPDGGFLYSSERNSGTLAGFRVDAASGRLTLLGHTSTQAEPRGFAIAPDGRFLFAAGQRSNAVDTFGLDPATGRLALLASREVGQGPHWITALQLP